MISVYFDGKCGLCSKEIKYYQRIAPNNIFDWKDIAAEAKHLDPLGVSQEDALRRLHAQDADGKLHQGVDAFLLIWRQLPRWRLLAFLVSLPIIRQLSSVAYNRFADYRFAKLPHCQVFLK